MIAFFVSSLLFVIWCSVLLFSIGAACLLLRSVRLHRALNQPGMTDYDLALLRAQVRGSK